MSQTRSTSHSLLPPPSLTSTHHKGAVIGLSVTCETQLPAKRFDFAARFGCWHDAQGTFCHRCFRMQPDCSYFQPPFKKTTRCHLSSSQRVRTVTFMCIHSPHVLDDQGDQGPLPGDHQQVWTLFGKPETRRFGNWWWVYSCSGTGFDLTSDLQVICCLVVACSFWSAVVQLAKRCFIYAVDQILLCQNWTFCASLFLSSNHLLLFVLWN